MEQIGQWPVGRADLVAHPLVGPGCLRPATVEVAGADHHRIQVGAVGERAAPPGSGACRCGPSPTRRPERCCPRPAAARHQLARRAGGPWRTPASLRKGRRLRGSSPAAKHGWRAHRCRSRSPGKCRCPRREVHVRPGRCQGGHHHLVPGLRLARRGTGAHTSPRSRHRPSSACLPPLASQG